MECPCNDCGGCGCQDECINSEDHGRCGCKELAELKDNVQAILKKHGTRSLLAAFVEILDSYRQDEIDNVLVKTLDYAGKTYAHSMGLQWWTETTLDDE